MIATVKIPPQTLFKFDRSNVRDLDINAPRVLSTQESGEHDSGASIARLLANKLITDSTKHDNHCVSCAYYAKGIGKIIILDQLSDKVNFYDLQCRFLFALRPNRSGNKNDRDQIILNIAWSER
jgi:hypothetical protein